MSQGKPVNYMSRGKPVIFMDARIPRVCRVYSDHALSGQGMKVITDRLHQVYQGLNLKILSDNVDKVAANSNELNIISFRLEIDNPGAVVNPSHDEFIKRCPAWFYYIGERAMEYAKSSAEILGMLHVSTTVLPINGDWVEQQVRDETGWNQPVYLAGPETTILE